MTKYPFISRLLLLLTISLVVAACASAPYTGRKQLIFVNESEEVQMGYEYSQQIMAEEKIETGTSRAKRVERIGRDIAAVSNKPEYEWSFKVIESTDVNAFCLPGGKVFVYTGILELIGNNDNELAAIMGHEVAHALARHGAERSSQSSMTNIGLNVASVAVGVATNSNAAASLAMAGGSAAAQLGILLPYSRKHETEADHIGVILSAKAGYDPRAAISLWQKMAALNSGKEPLGILSTHPLNSQRIADLEKVMPEALKHYKK